MLPVTLYKGAHLLHVLFALETRLKKTTALLKVLGLRSSHAWLASRDVGAESLQSLRLSEWSLATVVIALLFLAAALQDASRQAPVLQGYLRSSRGPSVPLLVCSCQATETNHRQTVLQP